MQLRKLLLPVFALFTLNNAIAQDATKEQYGKNVIGFSPLLLSAPGVGFGISYEHELDKKGIAAFYLPVSFSISNSNNANYYYYGPTQKFYTGYFMPGIKFYPTSSKGKVKYAIGANLVARLGGEPIGSNYDPLLYTYNYAIATRLSIGTMVFNSLNINPTEHLHIGVEMGIGVAYIDQINDISTNEAPALFQLGAKIGYRF